MQSVVTFEGVNKSFSRTRVLTDLSFEVTQSTCTALVGNNGCGKSTIVNILCNIIPIDSGKVSIYGRKLSANYMSYKRRVGFVLSKPVYVPNFTAMEYLNFVCKFQEVEKGQISTRIKDVVDFLKIQSVNIAIKDLSLGNQMKVSLAAALVHNPDFLILDEPFVNLDVNTTENLLNLLKSFYGKKTILITSHSLDIITELCDRFIIIKDGHTEGQIIKDNVNTVDVLKTKIKRLLEESAPRDIPWLSTKKVNE